MEEQDKSFAIMPGRTEGLRRDLDGLCLIKRRERDRERERERENTKRDNRHHKFRPLDPIIHASRTTTTTYQ